jgi:hypothetical protein
MKKGFVFGPSMERYISLGVMPFASMAARMDPADIPI